jgi:hypothetical protein
MNLVAVAGVGPQAAVVGLLVGVAVVAILVRVMSRRSAGRSRTLVSLNGR